MPPNEEISFLENVVEDIMQGMREMLMNGQRLSEELQNLIADQLESAISRIEQLEDEQRQNRFGGLEPPPPPPEKLKLSRPMPSSNVHSFGYDPANERLYVRFQGKWPDQNGPVYQYEGVPENIFTLFRTGAVPARTQGKNAWGEWWKGKVPSLGASLYTLIKNMGYPYQKLT